MPAAQFNRLCARCCTQHLTHTRSGKRHVEPTIGWLCVLRFNSEKSVIVAALTLASPMTPFSRLLSHEHYLSHSKTNKKTRKIWPKALPHYVLIFLCRHREMYYYVVHLRSSCYIMPLFLLLISPSALTLSDLYFRNTSPGQKQYSNTSPCRIVVVGFLVPLTQLIFVFSNTSPAHKLLYRISLCSNVAGKARPLSVIHGIMSTILLIFSNSLDDADEWHRSHSMH